MTASTLQDGVGFTFGPMHTGYNSNYTPIGVPWNEISIELSDGNGTVAWAPEESALRTGAASTEALASLNLGIITVRCNITDLDGNGWANRGDRFTLRMTGSNDFLSNEIYSVKVVYETIPGNVFNYTFRG